MVRATLLLPNFNNERVLPVTFDYLRRHLDCSLYDLVIVDDGSEDDGVRVAKEQIAQSSFHRAEIIECSHLGIVSALNSGLEAVRTEFVIRIDGDATVETPHWIELMLSTLQFDEVGLVAGQILWETGRVHSLGRSVFSPAGLFDMGCCPLEPIGSRTFDSLVHCPLRSFQDGPIYEVDSALGVCAAFRKSDAAAVGGFDPRFNPVWIEDDDFGLALRRIGKRVLVDPRIRVTHRPSLRGHREPGRLAPPAAPHLIRRAMRKAGRIWSRVTAPPPATIEDSFPIEQNPWRTGILRSHYAKWNEKWGFDPLNPDLLQIADLYWESALCWQINPKLLAESRAFLKRLP